MILYGNQLSTYTARVRIALDYKGIQFKELEPPDGYRSDAWRKVVSMGSIPALIDGDFVLSESEAIVEYLNDLYPEPALLPTDPKQRALSRSLSRMHDSWVEPRLRALYPLLRVDRDSDDARLSMLPCMIDDLLDRLQRFDNTITPAPYACGADISIADCAWPTTLLQIELVLDALGRDHHFSAKMNKWRRSLAAHPAFSPSIDSCRSAMTQWLRITN